MSKEDFAMEMFALLERMRTKIQKASVADERSSFAKARTRAQLDLLDYFERELNRIYLDGDK